MNSFIQKIQDMHTEANDKIRAYLLKVVVSKSLSDLPRCKTLQILDIKVRRAFYKSVLATSLDDARKILLNNIISRKEGDVNSWILNFGEYHRETFSIINKEHPDLAEVIGAKFSLKERNSNPGLIIIDPEDWFEKETIKFIDLEITDSLKLFKPSDIEKIKDHFQIFLKTEEVELEEGVKTQEEINGLTMRWIYKD